MKKSVVMVEKRKKYTQYVRSFFFMLLVQQFMHNMGNKGELFLLYELYSLYFISSACGESDSGFHVS